MTFDLNAAILPDGPVTSWTDGTLTLTSPVPATAAGGVLTLPPNAGDLCVFTGTSVPVTDGVGIHVVMSWSPAPEWASAVAYYGDLALEVTPTGVQAGDATAAVGAGSVVVVSLVADGGVVTLYVNGDARGTTPMASPSGDGVTLLSLAPASAVAVRRFVSTASSGAAAMMSALVAEYVSADPVIHAVGTMRVVATASLSAEDPWVDPEPPSLGAGGAVEPPEDPEPQDPPAKVKRTRIRRVSEVMPHPSLGDYGHPVGWAPTSVTTENVGRLQLIVEGVDVTYFRDVETPFPTWSRTEPFGAATAQVELPQITAFDSPGSGDLAWCREGANVVIRLVNGTSKTVMWRGVVTIAHHAEDTGVFTLECTGNVMAADLQLRTPPFLTAPQDVGLVVARALNSATSRRYRKTAPVVTGCKTSVLGGWEPTLTGWVTQALSTAVTKGRQWTVECADKQPVIVRKDLTTVHWTIRAGQRGIAVALSRDITQAANVIYGEGIRPDGGAWRNAKYPNWRPDDTPDFDGPMSTGMTVGWSSPGVRLWQEKVGQPVTGTLSQADRVVWRRIQDEAGIRVDDYLGPQTWAASFATGSNTGTLDGALIRPLAWAKEVERWLYSPDGDVLGENPRYDSGVLPVHRYLNFGAGVTKSEGVRAAKELLARDADPGWVGTITFTLDPNEGSKYEIREGHNIRVRSFRGGSVLVHVARVEYGPDQVTCTVDSKARDYPTLDAILDREREAVDPVRAYRKRPTSSTLASERATWDAESPGGRVPEHAVFGGLWNVLRIPFSQYGDIVRTSFKASTPVGFAVAVFDRPITANRLAGIVGNPLTAAENPWQEDELDDAGLLMAWGWKEQPCGYFPREYANPDGKAKNPPTGRMRDDASWTFASTQPPWLWVAVIATESTRIAGRFYAGVR